MDALSTRPQRRATKSHDADASELQSSGTHEVERQTKPYEGRGGSDNERAGLESNAHARCASASCNVDSARKEPAIQSNGVDLLTCASSRCAEHGARTLACCSGPPRRGTPEYETEKLVGFIIRCCKIWYQREWQESRRRHAIVHVGENACAMPTRKRVRVKGYTFGGAQIYHQSPLSRLIESGHRDPFSIM